MTRYDPTLQDCHQISLLPLDPVVEDTKESENDQQKDSEVAAGLALTSLFKDSELSDEEVLEEPVKRQSFFLSTSDERIQGLYGIC